MTAADPRHLRSHHDDYFVLKPLQSAFVATPLAQLLDVLHVHRLIMTGVASDQCVLNTATDARMRDLEVVTPRDCTGTQTPRRHAMVMKQCPEVSGIAITTGARIRLPPAASRRSRARETR